MGEFVNVSWAVVLVKSIGAANGWKQEGWWRVVQVNYIKPPSTYQETQNSVPENFTNLLAELKPVL